MPNRQPLTAHDINRLTESITELSEQVEVLGDVLDEIRSDLQWAVRNDRLVALPIGCIEHTAVKRMATDPTSAEWGSRLETETLHIPTESGVEQVTRTVESVIHEVMTAAVGLAWVRDQVRKQTDEAEEALLAEADEANDQDSQQEVDAPDPSSGREPGDGQNDHEPNQPPAQPQPTPSPVQAVLTEGRRGVQQLLGFPDDPHPEARPAGDVSDRRLCRIRPPVKAHGGKYYLAPKIVPVLRSAPGPVTEYLEPCAYGASIFLAMPRHEREILGDINPDIVDLWRVLSDEQLAGELGERLSETTYTEPVFQSAKRKTPVTALARAFRAIITCRFSRGGLGKDFAWSERLRGGRPGDENAWETFRETELPKIIERARGIQVVSDPCWWTVWESRHRIHRLIYADPPYMRETRTAREAYGPYEMTRLHHFWLIAALRAHTGPAAISGYRCHDYDRWLRNWRRFDFDMPNNAGQGRKKQRRTESLWVNW